MVDVYYPFFQREAIWEELRYSIRSVCKHLKEDFRLVIVGDRPEWFNVESDHIYIPHTRCEGMNENSVFDAVSKLLLYLSQTWRSNSFVRIYDDTYLLQDMTCESLEIPKAMWPANEFPDRHGIWWNQLRRTISEVSRHRMNNHMEFPIWNYETHFPELFHGDKMLDILHLFDVLENRLLTSTLYWNTVFPRHKPLMFKKDWAIQFYNNENGRFYDSSEGDLEAKCRDKFFLNHNNPGLNDNLKRFLMNRFPEKCRFEK